MKKILSLFILFSLLLANLHSQEVLKVWGSADPPTQYGYDESNRDPEMFIYLPQQKDSIKTPAVLIFPGGGYAGVGMVNEGHVFAKWLASQGIAGIILKYRLPNHHKEVPFDDGEEAMHIIERNADRWNINLDKVGIAGFSAGGHLAAVLTNNLVNQSDLTIKPAFNILFYPVISFAQVTKGGTRTNLLGPNPSADDIRALSAELLVTERTPTTIILVSDDDDSVPSVHSSMYYDALKDKNIPASMYIFPVGGHGWGMLDSFKYNKEAMSLLGSWLKQFD